MNDDEELESAFVEFALRNHQLDDWFIRALVLDLRVRGGQHCGLCGATLREHALEALRRAPHMLGHAFAEGGA
jgi:hypothetical protein